MLPNWIIAGAPKAATSSLFCWLVDHPEVSGSKEKETYYFVDPGTHMYRADRNFQSHGMSGYERLFEHGSASARAIIESTPGYMYSETALRELPHLPTQPSFIFVLREPVAQLRSLFLYFQQNWNWVSRKLSFEEFIAAVQQGRNDFKGNELAANALRNAWYPIHLRRWQERVGSDRMFILLFEDLVSDSRASMRRIAERLGIDPSFYDTYDFPAENQTYEARSGALQDLNIWLRARLPQGSVYNALRRLYRAVNTRPPSHHAPDMGVQQRLTEHYAPMFKELERDFGLDLTSWRSALIAAPPEKTNAPPVAQQQLQRSRSTSEAYAP